MRLLAPDSKEKVTVEMGCYGLGITRIMSSIVEQHHDDRGIIWPASVSPFRVLVLPLSRDLNDPLLCKILDTLSADGCLAGDVLVDDREESFGVKINEAELLGFPFVVIVGKNTVEDAIEVKVRRTMKKHSVSLRDLPSFVLSDSL